MCHGAEIIISIIDPENMVTWSGEDDHQQPRPAGRAVGADSWRKPQRFILVTRRSFPLRWRIPTKPLGRANILA